MVKEPRRYIDYCWAFVYGQICQNQPFKPDAFAFLLEP